MKLLEIERLKDFARDGLSIVKDHVCDLHFLNKDREDFSILISHDTYKTINLATFYLDDIFESFKSIKEWKNIVDKNIIALLMRKYAEIIYGLLNTRDSIKDNIKYVESHMNMIRDIYLSTEVFEDFIMMPDGQIFKCNGMSHDMTIALAIQDDSSYSYLKNIIPSDFNVDSPIILDRSLTDNAAILRFHVKPTNDGYIIANVKNIKVRGPQKYRIERNYLYRCAQ